MKYLIISLIVSLSVLAVHTHEDLQEIREECMKEVTLEPEQLEFLKKKDFSSVDKSTVKDNVKCFLECAYKKMEILKDNGEVDADALEKALNYIHENDAATVTELKEKCKTLEGGNACEKAYNLAACIHG